jgi:hypothetical protein
VNPRALCAALGGLSLLVLSACSSSGSGGTTTSTAGTGTTSGGTNGGSSTGGSSSGTSGGMCNSGTSTGGSPCNSIANGASVVQEQQSPNTAPSPQGGGVPADGTYYMTALTVYTGPGGASGPTGNSGQQTVQFTSSTMTLQIVDQSAGCPAQTQTGTLTFSGMMLTLATTCPANCGTNCGGTQGYTWNSPTLEVFETHGTSGLTRVRTLTHQP